MIVLPSLLLLWGIIKLFLGEIVTFGYILAFWIIPLVILIVGIRLIRSNRSRESIRIRRIVIVSLSLFLSLFYIFIPSLQKKAHYGEDAFVRYASAQRIYELPLPTADELGTPKVAEYHEVEGEDLFSSWDADVWIFKYDAGEFATLKQRLGETIVFDSYKSAFKKELEEQSVSIDDYTFRWLSDETYSNLRYPTSMCFVGINDTTQEIVIIKTYEASLSRMNARDYILNSCGWKHIR